MRAHLAPFLTLGLLACADPGEPGAAGNLGVAGASCLRTPDCQSPLQCIANVCAAFGGGDTQGVADVADARDGASEPADTGYAIDGTNPYYDGVNPDVVTDYDAADWTFFDTRDTSTTTTPDAFFDDCGELGVSDTWAGTFVGEIEFNVSENPLTPSQGVLPVNGKLTFDITCIETKFVVRGEMDGVATVENQGDFPFKLKLAGYYSPAEKRMEAQITEGSVSIYDLIEVYFEGVFNGAITDAGVFNGTWAGESTGTNQAFITGEASGEGLWGAEPQ